MKEPDVPDTISMRRLYLEVRSRCEDPRECHCDICEMERSSLLMSMHNKVLVEVYRACPEATSRIRGYAKPKIVIRKKRRKVN